MASSCCAAEFGGDGNKEIKDRDGSRQEIEIDDCGGRLGNCIKV